jgi:hypothetical protein
MPKNDYDHKDLTEQKKLKFKTKSLIIRFALLILVLHNLFKISLTKLPTKIINIQKTFEEVPIINLSDLSN